MAQHPITRDRATLVERVTIDRAVHQIEDVLADPDYRRTDFQRMGGYRTMMGAPMVVGEQVFGALNVWRTQVAPFDEGAKALLTTFAEQAALALRHVELVTALESRSAELGRKVDQLEALADVGEAISSTLVADEVLTTIVSHAVELSGTDGGSLMEFDEATGLFGVRTAYGTSPHVIDALRAAEIHIDRTWVGRAARNRQVLQISDLDTEPLPLDPHLEVLRASGWRSLVAIPLVRPDRVVGALVVRRKSTGSFSDETCELLDAFASQSAVALTNARLYQQLEQQSVELADASRHKSEFLASMSHELRTPLNAVIGFSEVLLERMFGELNDRQEDYLKDVHAAGRHLLALLGDILDLSKIEAGRMELDLSTFPMDDVLVQALALVRERAAQHGIRLTLHTAEIGPVTADELRLKQVLLNLLSNAVKFTPDGGGVDVRAWRDGDEVDVTVTDTGIGIDAGDQERIFDSFQQGERSVSSSEGTGLGLTVSRRIIELHGGRLWVSSTPGEGRTFGIALPQPGRAQATGDQDPWMLEDAWMTGPIVVVIEDDPRSAELVELHLRAAGLHALGASTGEQGLELVRTKKPVAVVLDIHLPGMDGWEVLNELKSDPTTADVPVVVVSVEPERGRGFALGATEYLVKPVSGDHLLAAVARLLPQGWAGDAPGVGRRSVVVVDDDPLALKLVRSTLEPLGWEVHTCAGGQQAADERGGIVEERVVGDEVRSPSVQMWVTPLGELEVLSTHDQILGGPTGQMYLGARFPADPAYATAITSEAEKVGRVLAEKGVLGRFALDFVVVRRGDEWTAHAIEVNLRKGGTTHPFLTLQFLTDGRYVAQEGRFRTPSGEVRHLVATDHLEDQALKGLRVDDLFDLIARTGLHYDQSRQSGVVFHMISSITECGQVGMTAIGDTPDSAQDVFDRAESALLAEARASLLPLPVPLPGRLGEGLK